MGETYYETLEIDSDATRDEIQAAYRERVLETHPDHNDAADATEQFQRVSRAKSVLTDGTERARYDRLGHDAYVRLAQYGSDSQTSSTTVSDDAAKSPNQSSGDATTGAETATAGTSRANDTGTATGRRTGSRDERTRTTDARSFETGDSASQEATRETKRATGASQSDETGEFRYSVHDWNDDIDLEWEGQPLSHTTAVTFGCLWLLYPVLVASSLTSLFPIVVNVIVGACTLGIVAYVLLRPRIGAAVFGSWSLGFPAGLLQFDIVDPTSVLGLVVLGCAWIPFGYAVGLWWALRP